MMLVWDDERIQQLEQLISDKVPVALMAERLGVTKNAIHGKLYRLGMPIGPTYSPRHRKIADHPRRTKTQEVESNRVIQTIMARARPPKMVLHPMQDRFADAGAGRVAFVDLEPGMCRFTFGADGNYLFCGDPISEPNNRNCSYCAPHMSLARGHR